MKMAFKLEPSKSSRARGLGGLAYIGAPELWNQIFNDFTTLFLPYNKENEGFGLQQK